MEMFWVFFVIYVIFCGYAVRWIARRRGIPDSWTLIVTGVLFNFAAVALYAFAPVSWLGVEKVPPPWEGEGPSPTSRLGQWRSKHPPK